MRCNLPFLAVLASMILPAVAHADEPSPGAPPTAPHIGIWSIDSATIGGQRFAAEDWSVEISADRIEILGSPRGARGERSTLLVWHYELPDGPLASLDDPRRFVLRTNATLDAPASLGHFEVSKNKLRACFNHHPGRTTPTGFEPELGRWVVSLTRQTEGSPNPDCPSESETAPPVGPADERESVRLLEDFAQDVRAFGALLRRAFSSFGSTAHSYTSN